eukprot:153046-Lingulodinium_polyedra.AAC.1
MEEDEQKAQVALKTFTSEHAPCVPSACPLRAVRVPNCSVGAPLPPPLAPPPGACPPEGHTHR